MIKIYVKNEAEAAFANQKMAHQVVHNPLLFGAAYEIIHDPTRSGTIEGGDVVVMAKLKSIVFPSEFSPYDDFDLRR